ncbi:mutS protein homolog 4 [Diaphorina citri]|uniref:MutS protein homolog 4 n=1 Tax=Diaphorina citri TaxID=121845 RepID=A0A3Q0IPF7_DIACI|nr:mutS protein homolog 4 [Diaphorina citri]
MTSSSTSSKLTRSGGELTKNKILYAGKTSSKSRSATSSSTDQHIRSSTSDLRTPRTKTRTQRTPGSSSSTQTEQSNVIMAITEGRGQARGEVGIAAIDTKHPKLILCQISDSPTYIHTLTKIHVLNPVQVIILDTGNSVVTRLNDSHCYAERHCFAHIIQFLTPRSLILVDELCREEDDVLYELNILDKGTGGGESVELVKNQEQNVVVLGQAGTSIDEGTSLAWAICESLIQTKAFVFFTTHFLLLAQLENLYSNVTKGQDFETSQKLELVLSQSNKLKSKCNLYGVLNHCVTMGGQRKLRSTILQPSCNSRVIKQRLDCVSELIENPRILCEIQTSLKKFSDIERLLSLCYEPTSLNKDSKKHFEQQINLTLLLKSALESLPPLIQTLAECHHPLFKSMKENFSDPRFKSILALIDDTIRTDAAPVKGYASSQMQRCFAVKENINSLLDVARTVYSEIVDDIYNKAREMSQEYDLPLRVCNSSSRAFHLSYATRKTFKLADLPPLFINVQLNKSRTLVTMTTEEIIFMNQRIKSALDEVHSMTNLIIRDLLKKAHEHMSCIYKLCEHIAELDLIVSLAQVSSSNNYVQPSFGSKMNVKNARHPLLDFVLPSEPVANDILCTRWKNFHIITGPNMSGKSVYIKQVALLQIMAQVGCYVPASLAEFRLADHIYTRIGFNDSIECNASTFALEMKEIAHIIQFLTPRSLILVDELCRGTSIDEGTSLAWAICESLIQTKAFVFFTTHFLLLAQLENLYSNVTNYHLEAKYKDSDQKSGVVYTHKLLPGVTCIEHYGLKLAEKTGLPRSIIGEAQTLAARLLREKQTDLDRELTEKADNTNEELIVKLLDHYENGTLNIDTVRTILGPFQEHANVQSLEDFEDRDASELGQDDGNSEERIQRNIEFDSNSGTRDDEQDDEKDKMMETVKKESKEILNSTVIVVQEMMNKMMKTVKKKCKEIVNTTLTVVKEMRNPSTIVIMLNVMILMEIVIKKRESIVNMATIQTVVQEMLMTTNIMIMMKRKMNKNPTVKRELIVTIPTTIQTVIQEIETILTTLIEAMVTTIQEEMLKKKMNNPTEKREWKVTMSKTRQTVIQEIMMMTTNIIDTIWNMLIEAMIAKLMNKS